MAKSDIILNDNNVVVKGELKVDNISSETVNKPVTMNSPLDIKAIRIIDSENKQAILINQLGFHMASAGVQSSFYKAGTLTVGGTGKIVAKNLLLSGNANVEKINSSQITLGGTGNGENMQNGKITLLNAGGQTVLTIDAASTAKIMVPGFGDIINELKQLKAKVALLERKIR